MFDRRQLIAALTVLGALPAYGFAAAPPLDEVIARHVEARGGASALDRVKRGRIKLDITERGQTIQGVYLADIAGLVRIDIYVGGALVYREGVDNKGVWLWPAEEAAPKASVAEGAANALLHGIESNLVGMHRFAERGHKLRLMPRATLDGVTYHVIEVVFRTGHTSYFYIDPTTWLIMRRRDERAYHPDADPTHKRVETRYSDFRVVGGVKMTTRNEDYDLADGSLLSSQQVKEVVWNPEVAPGVFDRNFAAPVSISAA
jgi:hypothetical protein